VGNLQYLDTKPECFIQHPFKKTAVFLTPVAQQGLNAHEKRAYELASKILSMVDPDFAAGEFVISFSWMNSKHHYVKRHVDGEDVSWQYMLGLGDYTGAALRAYHEDGTNGTNVTNFTDIDYRHQVLKCDGRLPHEVLMSDSFQGNRFSAIWFKTYDKRQKEAAPLLPKPEIVWPKP
jgi:hypothetical protein